MQSWDYLVFVPLALAIGYLWRRSRKKNASCGACSSCPAGGCATTASDQKKMG